MPKITINGSEIEAESGETILEVARKNGIEIPTLCYYDRLTKAGTCRMCLVEVEKTDLEELSKKYPEGWAGKYRSWGKE